MNIAPVRLFQVFRHIWSYSADASQKKSQVHMLTSWIHQDGPDIEKLNLSKRPGCA